MKSKISAARKKRKKASFFSAVKEGFAMSIVMIFFDFAPTTYLYLNADKLGSWWLILLLAYMLLLIVAIYFIYRYRTIVELRGYYSREEFMKQFPEDVRLMRFMERLPNIFIN